MDLVRKHPPRCQDASRKILAGGEYESATAEHGIQTLQNAIDNAAHRLMAKWRVLS